MSRRLTGVLLLLALLAELPNALNANDNAEQQLRLAVAGRDRVFVTWFTDVEHGRGSGDTATTATTSDYCVQYAPASRRLRWRLARALEHSYDHITHDQWRGNIHTAVLTQISPDTEYVYRVGGCNSAAWTEEGVHSFTLAGSDTITTIAVFGDQGVSSIAEKTAQSLIQDTSSGAIHQVWHLGDFGYNLPDPLQRNWDTTQDWYIELKQRTWDHWGAMMSKVTSRVMYMTLPGNHETDPYDLSMAPYLHRFPMPWATAEDDPLRAIVPLFQHSNGDPTALRRSRLFYSFDTSSAHVVMLNSEEDYDVGSAQYEWLAADLKSVDRIKQPHIIVCSHRPMYSSALKQGSNLKLRHAIEELLLKNRVSIVLSGHDHSYERSHPIIGRNGVLGDSNRVIDGYSGIVHIRMGTGGISHLSKWKNPTPPIWTATRSLAYGYGRLQIVPGGDVLFEFVKVAPDERTEDDGVRGVIDTVRIAPPAPVAETSPLTGLGSPLVPGKPPEGVFPVDEGDPYGGGEGVEMDFGRNREEDLGEDVIERIVPWLKIFGLVFTILGVACKIGPILRKGTFKSVRRRDDVKLARAV